MPEDHSEMDYQMFLVEAERQMKASPYAFVIILRGTSEERSTIDQIDLAKKYDKPLYLVKQEGAADPSNLEGADVRGREYITDPNKSRTAIQRLMDQAAREIGKVSGITMPPDLEDMAEWPRKEDLE